MANRNPGTTFDSTQGLLEEWDLRTGEEQEDLACDGTFEAAPVHLESATRLASPRTAETQEFAAGFELSDGTQSQPGSLEDRKPTRATSNPEEETEARQGSADASGLPGPGDVIAGFAILHELGRGAFARVYLAEELNLGRRLVAIKVSRAQGDEPRNLARLQHTHIVPVHSVVDDPRTGLRVLCMPYVGGANLAQVLDRAGGLSHSAHGGRSLVQAIDDVSRSYPADSRSRIASATASVRTRGSLPRPIDSRSSAAALPTSSVMGVSRVRSLLDRLVHPHSASVPAPGQQTAELIDPDRDEPCRRFLKGASSIQAAAWILARLAEGLDHAHSRGLLHRDIKPANVLLASDGTPMLLDFNLAVEQALGPPEGQIRKALVGGTLPYMSPEHLDAFNPRGATQAHEIDERSDLYALGIIFFEMLTGEHPFPEPPPCLGMLKTIELLRAARRNPPSLKARCPQAPWSLDALTRKCLSYNPAQRYAHARDLAEDLRAFLEDRPMKHCPEPSLRERATKWARRHPGLTSASSVAVIALLMITMLGAGAFVGYRSMRVLAARVKTRVFDHDYTESRFLLGTAGRDDVRLKQGLAAAKGTLATVGLDGPALEAASSWLDRLEPEEKAKIVGEAVELILLEERARVGLAARLGTEKDLERALNHAIHRLNSALAVCVEPPAAVHAELARYHAALGDPDAEKRERALADSQTNPTCHDLTMLAETELASGDPRRAEEMLRRALALDVSSFWTWFVLGHCHYQQGRFLEAAGDFAACIARGPRFAWAHFNRGLALARAGRLLDAKVAYDTACTLAPSLVEAVVNRGLVELELDQPAQARADFERALALGRKDTVVLTALAEACSRLGSPADATAIFARLLAEHPGDPAVLTARAFSLLKSIPEEARRDLAKVLARDPRNPRANYGLALLERGTDPAAALDHLDQAILRDRDLLDAVQLRALVRGRQGDAGVLDDIQHLLASPTPTRYYNAACALALYAKKSGRTDVIPRVIDLLARAIEGGIAPGECAQDPDLAILHGRAEFQRLVGNPSPNAG